LPGTYDDAVTSGSSGSLWRRFEHDPRDPAYSGMRASDRDRAVVQDALAEAYAEGRLDREELDERTAAVDRAKTYADLVPPLRDLTVDAAASAISLAPRADLERKAQAYYREKLGEAFMGLIVPNLICWVIWLVAGAGFPWPLFVLIPTGANFARVAASKSSIIEQRIEKLERRQAKALEPPKPPKKKPESQGSTPDSDPEPGSGSSGSTGSILSENRQEPEEA
jgi:hypothetical protein